MYMCIYVMCLHVCLSVWYKVKGAEHLSNQEKLQIWIHTFLCRARYYAFMATIKGTFLFSRSLARASHSLSLASLSLSHSLILVSASYMTVCTSILVGGCACVRVCVCVCVCGVCVCVRVCFKRGDNRQLVLGLRLAGELKKIAAAPRT